MVVDVESAPLEQIVKQLNKLINVIKISELDPQDSVERELMLVTVKAPATRREPKQFPVGIEQVVVNGRLVVDRGAHTGVLAGRALRRGRATT